MNGNGITCKHSRNLLLLFLLTPRVIQFLFEGREEIVWLTLLASFSLSFFFSSNSSTPRCILLRFNYGRDCNVESREKAALQELHNVDNSQLFDGFPRGTRYLLFYHIQDKRHTFAAFSLSFFFRHGWQCLF